MAFSAPEGLRAGGMGRRQTPLLHTRNKAPNRVAVVLIVVVARVHVAIAIRVQVVRVVAIVGSRRPPVAVVALVVQIFVVVA